MPRAQVAAPGAQHPLRVYCEYLSYIFRKAPMPPEQELLELSYRDYLQARPPPALASCTAVGPGLGLGHAPATQQAWKPLIDRRGCRGA